LGFGSPPLVGVFSPSIFSRILSMKCPGFCSRFSLSANGIKFLVSHSPSRLLCSFSPLMGAPVAGHPLSFFLPLLVTFRNPGTWEIKNDCPHGRSIGTTDGTREPPFPPDFFLFLVRISFLETSHPGPSAPHFLFFLYS